MSEERNRLREEERATPVTRTGVGASGYVPLGETPVLSRTESSKEGLVFLLVFVFRGSVPPSSSACRISLGALLERICLYPTFERSNSCTRDPWSVLVCVATMR